jgi:DNA-binding transcriptional MerR regulator
MRPEKQQYTVQQLAEMAGVSARTLRYYDQIGLLQPQREAHNGYRRYDREALLRLQYILFLRQLDLPLEAIKAIIDRPDFDRLQALEQHREELTGRQKQLGKLLATLERTISMMKGQQEMDDHALFKGFTPEEEARNTEEARQQWGDTEAFRQSQERWGSYSPAKKQQVMDEGREVYKDIISAMPLGPGSEAAQAGVKHWHEHLRYFYEPSSEMLLGLAEMYNEDPRFKANFDKMQPGLAEFMREAVKIYVK